MHCVEAVRMHFSPDYTVPTKGGCLSTKPVSDPVEVVLTKCFILRRTLEHRHMFRRPSISLLDLKAPRTKEECKEQLDY